MRKKRWRLRRRWPVVLTVVFLLLMAGAAGAYYVSTGRVPSPLVPGLGAVPGRTNILLLGTDARVGEPSQRTDTMILCSIDPASRQVALLSRPRDTRVALPGHGMDKINDADVYGGPDEAMSVVGNLLGVDVNYYVLVNFNGFKDIVDTLGGVTIDVKSDMYHYDPMDGGIYTIDLKKGVQLLDGTKALEFVRFRDDPTGDIARTERQQEFLTALVKKMMSTSSLTKLPALVPEVMRYVHTNLPLPMVLSLARTAADMSNLQVVHQTLPGYFLTVDGVSYWGVNPAQARQVTAAVLNGRTTSQVVLAAPPAVSQVTYPAQGTSGTTVLARGATGAGGQGGVSGGVYGAFGGQTAVQPSGIDSGNAGSVPGQGLQAPGGGRMGVPGARVTISPGPAQAGSGVQ